MAVQYTSAFSQKLCVWNCRIIATKVVLQLRRFKTAKNASDWCVNISLNTCQVLRIYFRNVWYRFTAIKIIPTKSHGKKIVFLCEAAATTAIWADRYARINLIWQTFYVVCSLKEGASNVEHIRLKHVENQANLVQNRFVYISDT